MIKYKVEVIHPVYGEVNVYPDMVDEYQLEQLIMFCEKHNETLIYFEVNEK